MVGGNDLKRMCALVHDHATHVFKSSASETSYNPCVSVWLGENMLLTIVFVLAVLLRLYRFLPADVLAVTTTVLPVVHRFRLTVSIILGTISSD